ncbi:[FeFe] hydrogenase, group A [Clostridium lacusfryxellense]|uniref:[FeFe] hydrogenase, group A n=1 Tax=Clostridium lacusfryxellense TaxID=205328 RepID=UPI001C0DC71A|nr:[FeFe] hydrogenase, group A [Clostridium lacusfryxellense]MBU3109969.1 [FeFe] hydrogenase, group A [Clostridium lacusfryxellense]
MLTNKNIKTNKNIININKELCTGCRRCSDVCPVDAIDGAKGEPQSINRDLCVLCGQCVQICSVYSLKNNKNDEPSFAAYNNGRLNELKSALKNPNLIKMVQCAPAVRVSIAEDFGLELGALTPGKLAAALRCLNFDRIYDTSFGADITIMEEGTELIKRIISNKNLPMFTSCCSAWVKYAEDQHPEILSHLSSCKSPMQMAGVIIKTYGAEIENIDPSKIFSVAVMPCTCKQYECDRENMYSSGFKDVDLVITTRELAYLIKDAAIDFANIKDEEFDKPLGDYSGAGTIFGATGGVMEAAIRTGYELITKEKIDDVNLNFIRGHDGIRTATVTVGSWDLKVAVVCGLKNANKIIQSINDGTCDYHFIEVMGCPQGCISGGGQPKILLDEDREIAYEKRKASLYKHDSDMLIRKSHENPHIKKLYKEFLGEPLGEKSHHLLHTKYKYTKI